MDFTYSPDDLKFRDELRGWLVENLPQGWGRTAFEPEDEDENARFRLDWERKLYQGRLEWDRLAEEYGGRGASLIEQAIFAEEMARAKAPEGLNIIGRNLVATTLLHHGSEAQRQRYLPKIISGEEVWCQGFSEPNAGSDLASVRCRAVRDGDHFVVNGQKIWTSFAQYAQWCILLVRTDLSLPKHQGISFLLVDMSTPGITIRPLKQISGESEFNETFFDDVRVPVSNLVGELNGGLEDRHDHARIRAWAGRRARAADPIQAGTRPAAEDGFDAEARRQTAISTIRPSTETRPVDCRVEVMRLICLRSFSKALKGAPRGPESSINKLYWSHVMQGMYETALEALGPLAPLSGPDLLSPGEGRLPAELSALQSLHDLLGLVGNPAQHHR